MISNFPRENAAFTINDKVLRYVLAYIDFVDILETAYVTGRPGIPRRVMLRCFQLKAYFGIASLRQLVQFLHHHLSW